MKRGWTQFWASVSLAALGAAGAATSAGWPLAGQSSPQRNELRLASLRPGRDTFAKARSLYGKPQIGAKSDTTFSWTTDLRSERLIVTTDSGGLIQEVRAEHRDDIVILDGEPQGSPLVGREGEALEITEARERLVTDSELLCQSSMGGESIIAGVEARDPDRQHLLERHRHSTGPSLTGSLRATR